MIGLGVMCLASGFYGVRNPQRVYEVRQSGQAAGQPELSESGQVMWRAISLGMVLLGIYTIQYGIRV